jgi:hypothetical protein
MYNSNPYTVYGALSRERKTSFLWEKFVFLLSKTIKLSWKNNYTALPTVVVLPNNSCF